MEPVKSASAVITISRRERRSSVTDNRKTPHWTAGSFASWLEIQERLKSAVAHDWVAVTRISASAGGHPLIAISPENSVEVLQRQPFCWGSKGRYLMLKQIISALRPSKSRIGTSEEGVGSRQVHRCRYCGSANVRRSRKRTVVENLLSRFFSLEPYRCDSCDLRFWDQRMHCSSSPRLKHAGAR